MIELVRDIKELEAEEVARANKEHGPFVNEREAHSVIQEELEEAEFAMKQCRESFNTLWDAMKHDRCTMMEVETLLCLSRNLAAESIQVCATVRKMKDLYKMKK